MSEYHIGCGAFGIYAGTLNNRNKSLWQNKTECTDEAITAVRDYMVQECLGGLSAENTSSGYEWTLKDGRIVELRVTIKNASPKYRGGVMNNGLNDKEFKAFDEIVQNTLNSLIDCADKHNIDRDSFIKYFSAIFGTMAEVSTFAQLHTHTAERYSDEKYID